MPRRFKGNAYERECTRASFLKETDSDSSLLKERMGMKWAGRFNFRHSGGKAERVKNKEEDRAAGKRPADAAFFLL